MSGIIDLVSLVCSGLGFIALIMAIRINEKLNNLIQKNRELLYQ